MAAPAKMVKAIVAAGRSIDVRTRVIDAVRDKDGKVIAEPFTEQGKLYGPGETVTLDADEAERLRLAGFVAVGDAEPVRFGAGPAVLTEDGVAKVVEAAKV